MDREDIRSVHELNGAPASRPAAMLVVMLIVGDDLYARTLERALARRGWRAVRARGTEEALQLWSASGAHAALVDLDDRLPALTLLSTLQVAAPAARAVVVTRDRLAGTLPASVKRRLGIEAIVTRPCHVDALANALAAVARAAGEAPRTPLAAQGGAS